MQNRSAGRRALALLLAATGALTATSTAWAHAKVSPPVVQAKTGQVFALAVPTEKEGLTTTRIELTPPAGFSIDSFVPAPGWKRTVQQTGSGDSAVVTKVTWTGGHVPTGEDAFVQFLGRTDAAKSYAFGVKQTYSDGSVVDWSGPESSDAPAPVLQSKSSLGGGGTSTLTIVALVVGALGLLLGIVGVVAGSGRRAVA
jgi:uncharacterized protein YcnI